MFPVYYLSYCLAFSLQPCDHLLGQGSLVCDVALCFCHFPILFHHHFSVIVTVCRALGAQGIYSTHGPPSFMHPLWLQKRNSGCILPLSYAYFALGPILFLEAGVALDCINS